MQQVTTISAEHLVGRSIAGSFGNRVIPEPMTLEYKVMKSHLSNEDIRLRFFTTELLIRFTKLSEVDQVLFASQVLNAAQKYLRPYKNKLAQPEGLVLHIEIPWTPKKRRKINVSFACDPQRVDHATVQYVLNLRLM